MGVKLEFFDMRIKRVSNSLIFIGLLGSLTYYFWLYLSNWGVYFNSDTAMIGLMQKHVLEGGELPIFVWKVGYMGMLLEGYLGALFQGWLGVGPFSANVPSAVFLFLFFVTFVLLIRKMAGWGLALLSGLLLAISTPWLYVLGLRPWPNYPETFFFGACLWWGYFDTCENIKFGKWNTRQFVLLGLLTGFSYYISPLSVFFILPLLAYTSFVYLRVTAPYSNILLQFRRVLLPYQDIKYSKVAFVFKVLTSLLWLNFVFGFCMFVLDLEKVQVGDTLVKWQPMAIMLSTAYYLAIVFFARLIWNWILPNHTRRKAAFFFVVGCFLGFFPALYYRFVLNKGSTKGLSSLEGTLSDVVERFDLMVRFHGELFSLSDWSNGDVILSAGIVVALVSALYAMARASRNTVRSYLHFPLFLFVPIILTLFLMNGAKGDLINGRYLIFLLPVYCISIAWFLRKISSKRIGLIIAIVGVCVYGYSGYSSTRQNLKHNDNLIHIQKIVEVLEKHNLKYGYANYWFAYPVNLLTKEKIILEPVVSNYSPHYGAKVISQKRIAYVSREKNSEIQFERGVGKIRNVSYRVISENVFFPGMKLWVLEKNNPELANSYSLMK